MSKRVEMTALQDVRVEGRVVKKGKPFTCELRDSKILTGTAQAAIRKKKPVATSKKTEDQDGGDSGRSGETGE
ncbi:MAG: hypothetical protein KZQ76_01120 [Candidatus Thiodiazotropha sp. (ex Epidulcina cf. delphinae)]|nr:hypothetical protein [Candidatus Thiodiazotropha sp. (ex Epidulcina cf. delphinae)]